MTAYIDVQCTNTNSAEIHILHSLVHKSSIRTTMAEYQTVVYLFEIVVDHNCLFRNICVGWPHQRVRKTPFQTKK